MRTFTRSATACRTSTACPRRTWRGAGNRAGEELSGPDHFTALASLRALLSLHGDSQRGSDRDNFPLFFLRLYRLDRDCAALLQDLKQIVQVVLHLLQE